VSKTVRIVLLIIGVLVVTGSLVLILAGRPPQGNTARVRRGSIEATVDALGRVEPQRQLALSTRASGTVRAIPVREGESVSEGALLLELDATDYRTAIEQAERNLRVREKQLEDALSAPSAADISLARARLRRATAARLNAQKDYDEIKDEPEAESSDEALDLEVAKLEYEIAKAEFDRVMGGASELQIEQLEAEVADARLALHQAHQRLGYAQIVAPFSGVVMRVQAQVDANVQAYTPVVWIADLSALEIVAEIDELDVPAVAEGQEVLVRFDAFPGDSVAGELVRLSPGPTDTRGVTTYEGRIRFVTSLSVRPGMGATLTITTGQVEGALLVPRGAVRQIGRSSVVRVLEGRRVREIVVVTGLSDGVEIEILSGLEEDDTVLLD